LNGFFCWLPRIGVDFVAVLQRFAAAALLVLMLRRTVAFSEVFSHCSKSGIAQANMR
jgi:hypothetical protein